MRIGCDIGRVIIAPQHDDGRPDSTFLEGDEELAMRVPAAPGAFDVLAECVEETSGNVWLVSKCGPRIAARSMAWLRRQDFFQRTNIPEDHVIFCRERKDKALHAVELQLTHFIDDRADVLLHLRGLVPNLILFGPQKHRVSSEMIHAMNWADVRRNIP